MDIIDITNARELPKGELIGPMTEHELTRVNVTGQTYRLTHTAPKMYVEYFLLPRVKASEQK